MQASYILDRKYPTKEKLTYFYFKRLGMPSGFFCQVGILLILSCLKTFLSNKDEEAV